MSITVKFFAALAERVGKSATEIDFAEGMSVGDVWRAATGLDEGPDKLLMAVNMEYSSAEQVVHDGDEIGFFPPVTGGGE